jgi:hypothetical protein
MCVNVELVSSVSETPLSGVDVLPVKDDFGFRVPGMYCILCERSKAHKSPHLDRV